jgi:hypothetical protein
MKHLVITFAFFIVIFQGFTQDNVFKVIDMLPTKANYMLLSCRDDYGRTLQFQIAKQNQIIDKLNKKVINPPAVGSQVTADFVSATVSPANYNFIKYKILKPSYSVQCCLIKQIQYLMSSSTSVYARIYFSNTNAPNETSSFAISSPFTSNIQHLTLGQPVYEKYFNKKKYAVLKPWSEEEINNNIFYSYELYVAGNNPQNSTDTSQGTVFSPIDSTIYNYQYNQPWEQSGTCNQYTPVGTLYVNAPVDAECFIKIYYSMYPSPFVDSSSTKRFFQLTTSNYNVLISGVKISNVPVCGLSQTRIKAGALNIISNSPWTLYDSNKVNNLYSYVGSKKVEFPRGVYQLEINGTTQQIKIIDGATLQIGDTSQAQTQKLNTGTQPWEILTDNTLTGATGQLVIQMPANIAYAHLKVFESGDTKMVASLFGNGKSKLIPGNYDLMLDKYSIKNVPIEVGKTTRLKIGRLNYSPQGSVRIVDANKQEFSMAGPFKIALPPGTYYIDGKKEHSFVIKDGEVTEY